ncbi:hypothetical protein [Xylanimonas protaetiae]|uniref:MmcB family DNA repair protein n=1 Tax=Xylanimonas protaetiae TaxID=2509457 RepID=A0A4P6FHC9_9MICO|nr:hypothetical protein [Xylanimonas protaetiae]QAY70038.1 hypothetical protein ET471_08315 [Xylanimonas protaetiae]
MTVDLFTATEPAKAPDRKLDAHAVQEMLRRHYLPDNRPASGAFVTEIQAPEGSRRADALWVPLTIAGGYEIVGHEIKVSRSDVLAELADPTKAEPWAKHCTRWWLTVSDPALVAGLDIPEAWGIMAPPSGRRTRTMTVIRQAPRLHPADTGPAFRRILAATHYRTQDRIGELERERDYQKHLVESAEARAQKAADRAAEAGAAWSSPHTDRIRAIVRAVEKASDDWAGGWFSIGDGVHHDLSDSMIVDGIVDYARTRSLARHMQDDLRRLAARSKETIESIAQTAAKVAAEAAEVSR